MRPLILIVSFVPFVYYGIKDSIFHFRGRKVSVAEHLLHAAIGLILLIMFTHALLAHHLVVLAALVIFAVAGGIDEYIFHREIPGEESDLHAKEHLALLIFLVISLATDWLQRNNWSLPQALEHLRSVSGGGT